MTRRIAISPIPMTIQFSIRDEASQQKIKGRPKAGLRNESYTNYFLGAIASLAALATRNLSTVLAGIWMGSPVCGLRPTRALRYSFTKRLRLGTTNIRSFLVSFT